MRIAACQLEVDLGLPFQDRVDRVLDLVRAQSDCDLVVLPELWANGAFVVERWAEEAQPLDGALVTSLGAAARDAGVWLHGGSFIERGQDGRCFNTSVLFDDQGVLRASYRKLHLFGFGSDGGERTVLSAGDEVVTCDTPFGTIGLTTCFDLRFPELYRELVDRGVVLALVPSAWPGRRIAHWQLLPRARAVENQIVVVAVNAVGQQGRVLVGGRTSVVDAWGELLAEAGAVGEQVLRVDVDVADVMRVREEFPVLASRRPLPRATTAPTAPPAPPAPPRTAHS